MYVPVPTSMLRKWYFGIFSKNSYVHTNFHTSMKLFVVPHDTTDFKKSVSWHLKKRIRVYYFFQKNKK